MRRVVNKNCTCAKILNLCKILASHSPKVKVSVNSSSTAVKLHVDCFKCQSNAMVMMMIRMMMMMMTIKGGGCQRSKITSIQRFTSSKK